MLFLGWSTIAPRFSSSFALLIPGIQVVHLEVVTFLNCTCRDNDLTFAYRFSMCISLVDHFSNGIVFVS